MGTSRKQKAGSCAEPPAHLFLIYTENDHCLILANTDELVDGSDAPAGQFAEQNQALEKAVGEKTR